VHEVAEKREFCDATMARRPLSGQGLRTSTSFLPTPSII